VDVIARTPHRASAAPLFALAWLAASFLYGAPAAGEAPAAREAPAAQMEPAAHQVLLVRDGAPRVEARLLVRPHGGEKMRVGVLFDLAPGWHVYWRNPGGTGLAPELEWDVPGSEAGPTQWPLPRAFEGPTSDNDLESYGYEEQVLLASDLAFETTPDAGTRLAVEGDVLVCESECVPASFRLERALGETLADLSPGAESALFDTFAGRTPADPAQQGIEIAAYYSQSVIRPGDEFDAAIGVRSKPGVSRAAFFPDDHDPIELRVTGFAPDPSEPDRYWIFLSGQSEADEPIEVERLSGVLALHAGRDVAWNVEVDLPLASAAAGADVVLLGHHWLSAGSAPVPAAEVAGMGLAHALLLALLGGLVLNLMPCVLPVLAIKVFSISEMAEAAHVGRAEPMRHGIAYTVGILGSMAALGTCVVVLRSAGHSVGWGFQFQEPIYIAAISAILVAFALNLFGTYEIRAGAGALGNLGQQATGARRSFFEGLLAVALATPCSAPFLGTAVGFAFASSPLVILAIFLAVGLGLAAPFALVTFVPGWARFVPRAGAWMQAVRAGLGFALLATCVWLLWLFGGAAGTEGLVGLVGFLLALAFALWCFGLLQQSDHHRTALGAGVAVVVFGIAGLNAVNAQIPADGAAGKPVSEADADWQTWSPEAVEAALAKGSPVFVRFTADWCITCKVNERVVLDNDGVLEALERGGFARLVGDWTQRDDTIRAELARHGRAGVPLYLLYHPDRPDKPQLLPELLTVDDTVGALRAAASGGAG
jgi:thiol:disulfide interchange protein/DsbC/DsbD-like thiol-disulfide interchange protein